MRLAVAAARRSPLPTQYDRAEMICSGEMLEYVSRFRREPVTTISSEYAQRAPGSDR